MPAQSLLWQQGIKLIGMYDPVQYCDIVLVLRRLLTMPKLTSARLSLGRLEYPLLLAWGASLGPQSRPLAPRKKILCMTHFNFSPVCALAMQSLPAMLSIFATIVFTSTIC